MLRNIIEQCIEWNATLYVCFVHFEKAFDSVDRSVLWRIMRSYRIPEKIVKMVKVIYSWSECAVIDGSGVYDWFVTNTGVKQGCFYVWVSFPACCGLGYETDHQTWEHRHQMEVQQLPRRSWLCQRPSPDDNMICKNDRPQNQYSKDQSRRKESKKTPKGPG